MFVGLFKLLNFEAFWQTHPCSGYMSVNPIPNYPYIKDPIVQGSKSVSVVWEIGAGKIILKNDQELLKLILFVLLDVE